MVALEVKNLSKTFRTRQGTKYALRSLSLGVNGGEIVGLLGPNGAGKTTLLRIIAGLVSPDQGHVQLFEEPANGRTLPRLLRRVGVLIERPAFEPRWSATTNLEWLRHYMEGQDSDIPHLLEHVGLDPRDGRPVRTYSLGMRQRLGLAATLLKRPELLLLDEPTNGLDPVGIAEFRDRLRVLAQEQGIAILVASHLLDEMQRICDRIAIISGGRLQIEGRLPDLLAGERQVLRLTVQPYRTALDVLRSAGFDAVDAHGKIEIAGNPDPRNVSLALVQAGLYASEIETNGCTLEDLYRQHTGRRRVKGVGEDS